MIDVNHATVGGPLAARCAGGRKGGTPNLAAMLHKSRAAARFGPLAALLLGFSSLVYAHGGEDHSHDAPAPLVVTGDVPARLADGSVFLPKAAQRQLGLRTRLAQVAAHAATLELNGRVIADPQAGGKVQATQSGRIELSPKAVLGRRVARGEVLATLRPLIGSLERGGQQAQLAELAAQIETGERRVARLEQLEGIVPAREIETAHIELQGLRARRAALGGSLGAESLRAPVAGVVAGVNVVAGQVVEARETLFEIVDPNRLAVEALAYDPGVATGLGEATAAVPGGELKLAFLGAGQVLREGALPVLFRIVANKVPVAVGQPLKVLARTRASREGVAVPSDAVIRDAGGNAQVWVHVGAERFLPRVVKTAPLDAASLLVLEGLAAGERVVVIGAAALARVR
ncbi:MAG: HlyD family efflux transporter periplasmic adaptor subunit [Pseudomonadota bacterium]|nr:HlyD family efflux transporter periplasmic adaptor subunit [Pseudomonadota bacterium]